MKYNIKKPYELIDEIKNTPYFLEASQRIIKEITLSNYSRKAFLIVMGIDLKREKKILKLYKNIDGNLSNGANIIIGKKFSELTEIKRNDSILMYGQTKGNNNNLTDINVSGIYASGFSNLETKIAYIPYDFAQEFFDMQDSATEIIIRLKDRKHLKIAKKYINSILREKYPELVLIDWKKEGEAVVSGAKADYISYAIIFFILLFLSIFTVMNTLTITVFERTREIATLRAMGLEKKDVRQMFMSEAIFMAIGGAILGCILSIPAIYYLNFHGLSLPKEALENSTMVMDSVMKSQNRFIDFVFISLITVFTSIIGGISPVIKAGKVKVQKALNKR